jgi:hypothetical protein
VRHQADGDGVFSRRYSERSRDGEGLFSRRYSEHPADSEGAISQRYSKHPVRESSAHKQQSVLCVVKQQTSDRDRTKVERHSAFVSEVLGLFGIRAMSPKNCIYKNRPNSEEYFLKFR